MDGVRQILLFDDITDAFNTFRAGLSQIAVKQGIFITNGTYEWYADGALIKERCVVQCDTSEWRDSETGLHIAKVQSFASFTPDAKVHKNALDALFCLTNKLNDIFTEKKGVLIYEKIKEKD